MRVVHNITMLLAPPASLWVGDQGLTLILMKSSNALCLFSKIRLNQQNVFATFSVSMGGVSLFIEELSKLANKYANRRMKSKQ